jgi:hypothetical protein
MKVHYERIPLRRAAKKYQEGGEVDPYDPLAASAGVAPAGTPRIDQVDWGQPSWAQQAQEQSQRDQEAYAREGVRGALRDTEGTQDLAGGFSDAGFAGTIKAYHGSPHDFSRFSLEHVGTGEGAQAYGHGLYFAENPGTAETYKHSTSDLKDWPVVGGDPQWRVPSWVGKTASASPRGLDNMIEDFTNRVEQAKAENHWNVGGLQDIVDALTSVKAGRAELKKPGKMYEVDIAAAPEHFLDWDKPLSEQSEHVRQALKRVSGLEKYSSIENALAHGAPEVSTALREAGVPGIKYLDQHSRWATDMKLGDVAPRTHNYVVFDDSLIDIIKKYGLAGLIAAGAAHFTSPADQARGMARGGAAQADDDMTPEDWESARQWYRGLIEDRAHNGKLHYSPVPVRGMPLPGSYRVPKEAVAALGQGDMKLGGYVLHAMLGVEDSPEDPTVIHPHVVRIIGNGSLAAGRRVLERFVAQVRRSADHHGWRAEEGEDGVTLHHGRVR